MLAAELDGGLLQARVAVGKGVGRIVERRFIAQFAVGAGEGEEQLVGRLGHGSSTRKTGVEGTGGRFVVGVDAQFVGCIEGEDQLRRSLGLGQEELAVVRVQAVHAQVHAVLGGGSAGGPVVVPQRTAGFHGHGGTLGYALDVCVAGGQAGNGVVKVLIDALQDNLAVDTALVVGLFQRKVLGVVRHVSEQEGQHHVGFGAEEFGLGRVLLDEIVGNLAFHILQAGNDGIGPRNHLVIGRPGVGHETGVTVDGTAHPVIELGTLVPVVGETVGVIQARALHIPQGRGVQGIEGDGNLFLVVVPVLGRTSRIRRQVQIDTGGQECCCGK